MNETVNDQGRYRAAWAAKKGITALFRLNNRNAQYIKRHLSERT